MEIRARVREESPGRWVAEADTDPPVRASASSGDRCLAGLRRSLERAGHASTDRLTLVVEIHPILAGVAEAAEIMGWDKRRVITYVDRGRFPEPIQSLASGRVWLRSDVERFAAEWRGNRARRPRKR